MKTTCLYTVSALVVTSLWSGLVGCEGNAGGDTGGHGHSHAGESAHTESHQAHGGGAVERASLARHTEVYLVHDPLRAGQSTDATLYITAAKDWSPLEHAELSGSLASGRVSFGAGASASDESGSHGSHEHDHSEQAREQRGRTHHSDAETAHGVYHAEIRPETSGETSLTITVSTQDFEESHVFGAVTVASETHGAEEHGHDHAATTAPHEAGQAGQAISLSKSNQWLLDFGVSRAKVRRLEHAVGAWARVRAPEGERVTIRAPFAGRLSVDGGKLPRAGSDVAAGEQVARMIPTPGTDQMAAARANLQQAELNVERAEGELKRVKRLFDDGALPERRLVDARHALRIAEARRDAAQNRLQQTKGVESPSSTRSAVAIRAPLEGRVVRRRAAAGTYVEAGAPLVETVSMSRRWITFDVPASTELDPDAISGAWFQADRTSSRAQTREIYELDVDDESTSLVTVGSTVSSKTQTVPVIFSAPAQPAWRPGLFVKGHVRTGEATRQVAVPASAVVERKGRPTVFVMTGGESFVRRAIDIGQRDGKWVGVTSGLKPGTRVVSTGAYYVKLAAAQTGSVGHHH